jgi:CheY-like chemotaxis protein
MKATIAVVDDEQYIVEILTRFLVRSGYEVLAAASSEEAMGWVIENKPFDLMVLDLRMPRITGYDILARIRQLKRAFPVVIFTGSFGVEAELERLAAVDLKEEGVLYKPIDLNKLLEVIKRKLPAGSP